MDGFENARRKIEECERNRPKFTSCCIPTGPTGPTEAHKSVNNKFQIITITEIMVLFCSKLLHLSSHQFLSYQLVMITTF